MNPLLEINPATCIVVVGPLVSRSCLSVVPDTLKLTYTSLIQAGLEMVQLDERGRLEELVQVDLDAASKELTTVLKRQGDFERWITSSCAGFTALFKSPSSSQQQHEQEHQQQPPQILKLLLNLQASGCRLVYTHYDNILDALAEMIPILPINSDHLEQWIEGQLKGFLHIHGHYSDSESLILDSSAYESILARQGLFLRLREFFKRRTLILIGHDPDHLNPLLVALANTLLLDEKTIRNPPLLLSSTHLSVPQCFLHLPISKAEENALHYLIVSGPDSSFIIGKNSDKPIDKEIIRSQAILIFSEKQSFRKLGDIIYQLNQSGEIYVRRDALTVLFGNKIMYGNILTYGGNGLHRIWQLVVPDGSVLRNKGLIALGLQNSLMIWINRKPSNLGPITEVNTFHSLWNNSAAIMKTQPSGPSSSSSSLSMAPFPPSSMAITATSPTTRHSSLSESHLSETQQSSLPFAPMSYSVYPFPIISPSILQLRPLVSSPSGISQGSRTLLAPVTNLQSNLLQLYGMSGPLLTQTHSRTASESSSQTASSDNSDSRTGGCVSMTGEIDVDSSKDSFRESQSFHRHSGPVCQRAASPMVLQDIIEDTLNDSECHIVPVVNPLSTTTVQSISRPIATAEGVASSAPTSLVSLHNPLQVTGQAVPQGLINPVSQVSESDSSSSQRPTTLPIVPLTSPILPVTRPTLQFPLPLTPFSILPSVVQTDTSQRLFYKLIPFSSPVSSSATPLPTLSSLNLLPNTMPSQITMPISSPPVPPASTNIATPTSIPSNLPPLLHAVRDPPKRAGSIGTEVVLSGGYRSRERISTSSEKNEKQVESAQSAMATRGTSGEFVKLDNNLMHLWEFILHLLLTPNHGNIIQWTGNNYEFSIINPLGLTTLWGEVTGNDNITFNTLLGELRSYSGLGILEQVEGKELTYSFVMDIQKYMSIYGHKIIQLTNTSNNDK